MTSGHSGLKKKLVYHMPLNDSCIKGSLFVNNESSVEKTLS